MNWINNIVRPKIRSLLNKRETQENLWVKCPETGDMVFYKELEANQWVVPSSGYHMKIKATDRMDLFFDDGDYNLIPLPSAPQDPLKFRDTKRYSDRLKEFRTKTGMEDAVLVATGKLLGNKVTVAVQDSEFILGSLGMAAGSAIVKGLETAVQNGTPFIIFTASGGARMQEGILSLMQLPRTTIGVQRLKEKGLPFIVVMTNPTLGGVTASYAMLGDVQLAEPGAVIGFAGARVIEQTIREKLPRGFQRAEYLRDHGMVDMVVHRHNLRSTIGSLVGMLMKAPAPDRALLEPPAKPVASARELVVAREGDGGDDLVPPQATHAE